MQNPEYLFAFQKRVLAGQGATIVMTGDSTTVGDSSTPEYLPHILLRDFANDRACFPLNIINRGQSGKHSGDWDVTFVAGDIAQAPHLYIVRWGLNDAYTLYARTVSDFEASMRSALAKIRAVASVSQASILLMSPNTANNMGRTPATIAVLAQSLKVIAKEYQCAFFDTLDFLQTPNDAWMDPILVHPAPVMNAAIYGQVASLIFPEPRVRNSEISLYLGWVPHSSGTYEVRSSRSGGSVHLRGVIESGDRTHRADIGLLAPGYRPRQNQFFEVAAANGSARIYVTAYGSLCLWACPPDGWVCLDGVSFHV